MDPLTQGLLGAVAAQVCVGHKLSRTAWLVGGLTAMSADLDVVLAREPGQHASRYLRAAVKRALGREAEAREDLSVARHAAPGAAKLYEAWGLLEN